MIILYVPFLRNHSGNLSTLVETWKTNYFNAKSEPIDIIYFNDNFDLNMLETIASVYICAHGSDSNELLLLNHDNSSLAQTISIETVANRFNYDFLSMHNKIHYIHIYCCGAQEKNEAIAKIFSNNLVLFLCPVISYSGSLFNANKHGELLTFNQGEFMPVKNTATMNYTNNDTTLKDNAGTSLWSERLKIRHHDLQENRNKWWSEAHPGRCDLFFQMRKIHRENCYAQARGLPSPKFTT